MIAMMLYVSFFFVHANLSQENYLWVFIILFISVDDFMSSPSAKKVHVGSPGEGFDHRMLFMNFSRIAFVGNPDVFISGLCAYNSIFHAMNLPQFVNDEYKELLKINLTTRNEELNMFNVISRVTTSANPQASFLIEIVKNNAISTAFANDYAASGGKTINATQELEEVLQHMMESTPTLRMVATCKCESPSESDKVMYKLPPTCEATHPSTRDFSQSYISVSGIRMNQMKNDIENAIMDGLWNEKIRCLCGSLTTKTWTFGDLIAISVRLSSGVEKERQIKKKKDWSSSSPLMHYDEIPDKIELHDSNGTVDGFEKISAVDAQQQGHFKATLKDFNNNTITVDDLPRNYKDKVTVSSSKIVPRIIFYMKTQVSLNNFIYNNFIHDDAMIFFL
jgi:hypothetical protein